MNTQEQTITRQLRLGLQNEKIKNLKILTDIYLLKDLSFSFLDGANIKYFENINLINLNDYQYYLSTKNCVRFLNFDFIFKDDPKYNSITFIETDSKNLKLTQLFDLIKQ